MNHSFIHERLKTGEISVIEQCSRCGQKRRRWILTETLYYEQLDGSWANHRPAPCTREHKRAILATEINRLVEFSVVEKAK